MENPPSNLQGKVVLVTGAAKRIGRGIALRLAREGARVAIHYRNSETEARATAEECGGAPLFRANLESVAEIARLFGEIERTLGRLDGLVNNAAQVHTLRSARDYRGRLGFHSFREPEGGVFLLPARRAVDA